MYFDENKLFILIVFCLKPQSMKHISCSQYRGWIILWGKSQPKGSLNCLIISFLNSNTYVHVSNADLDIRQRCTAIHCLGITFTAMNQEKI